MEDKKEITTEELRKEFDSYFGNFDEPAIFSEGRKDICAIRFRGNTRTYGRDHIYLAYRTKQDQLKKYNVTNYSTNGTTQGFAKPEKLEIKESEIRVYTRRYWITGIISDNPELHKQEKLGFFTVKINDLEDFVEENGRNNL